MKSDFEGVDCLVMKRELEELGVGFISKPIIIGGMAMQYYDIRERGEDIDLVVTDDDYKKLLTDFSDKQKDVWGDLGIRIGKYEIFRSITLFDYNFYKQGAVEVSDFYVLSLEKLLFTRVLAIKNDKHKKELELIKDYYYKNLRNAQYLRNALSRYELYCSTKDGIIWGGKYDKEQNI